MQFMQYIFFGLCWIKVEFQVQFMVLQHFDFFNFLNLTFYPSLSQTCFPSSSYTTQTKFLWEHPSPQDLSPFKSISNFIHYICHPWTCRYLILLLCHWYSSINFCFPFLKSPIYHTIHRFWRSQSLNEFS